MFDINKFSSYLIFELKIAIRAYDSFPIALFIIFMKFYNLSFNPLFLASSDALICTYLPTVEGHRFWIYKKFRITQTLVSECDYNTMLALAKLTIGAALALSGLGGAGVKFKFTSFNNYSTSVNPNGDNPDFKLSLPSFASEAPKVFVAVLNDRIEMSKQLKGRSGIYCWINLFNGKYYIGSAVDLGNRVNDYFQDSYYKSRANTIIVRAILKYGIGNFSLVILEFVDKDNLLSGKNHFIETFKPEYNILRDAKNSIGFKHTPESLEKFRESSLGRTHSLEARQAMSVAFS